MRHKRIQISILFLLGLGLTGMQAQTMLLNQLSGEQTQYAVGDIRKMTFSSGSVSIAKTIGLSDDYSLNGLRSLGFTYAVTGWNVSGHEKRVEILQLYPNPAGDYITVVPDREKDRSGEIEILSPEGRVIFKEQIECKNKVTLDLSALPNGIYFCRYRAGTTLKTAKLVKL